MSCKPHPAWLFLPGWNDGQNHRVHPNPDSCVLGRHKQLQPLERSKYKAHNLELRGLHPETYEGVRAQHCPIAKQLLAKPVKCTRVVDAVIPHATPVTGQDQ